MKILQLISSGGFFGAENVLIELTKELKKIPTITPVVGIFKNSLAPHLEVADACVKLGISNEIINCRGRFDFKAVLQLREFIKSQKIDIVHSHGYKSNLYACLATIGLKTAIVATCHNWASSEHKMKFYALLDRFILKRFEHVVAVSEEVKNLLIRSRVKAQKTSVIRNGISLERFNTGCARDQRETFGIPRDAIVIGTVGRISEEKGHEFLLKTVSNILHKHHEVAFLLVGDGNLKEYLAKKYTSPSIHFAGTRNDIPEMLGCMDIFVLPSLTEGLPMALLEAMVAKLPVVASSVGAIPTIIKNYENGLLVKPGSGEEMEEAMFFMLENKEKRKEMAQRGYEKVRDEYSSEKMANEYMKIYQKLTKSTDSTDVSDLNI